MQNFKQVEKLCTENGKRNDFLSRLAKFQYDATVALIRTKCKRGTAALIFVSGIADIVELQMQFDSMEDYEVVAIHSEIPFEEQEVVFSTPPSNLVRVIITTNAAQSSVTLSKVDVVICLGTQKEIHYKAGDMMRSTLENVWISKSSATQRAGRTGRTRPGTVYRLYTKEIFGSLSDFDEPEVCRAPLHEMVLSLKAIFYDVDEIPSIIPILMDLLTKPDITHIHECFQYLHSLKMITDPSDMAPLTSRGLIAGILPLDVSLSNLVMYGISLGVGLEAIIAAAALSESKSPFRLAHSVIHTDPLEFNKITRKWFLACVGLDNNLYSDSLMMIELLKQWITTPVNQRNSFCYRLGLIHARMQHFASFSIHLIQQVNTLLFTSSTGIDNDGDSDYENHNKASTSHGRNDHSDDNDDHVESNGIRTPSKSFSISNLSNLQDMSPQKINRIRLAMLWALKHNLIRSSSDRKQPKSLLQNSIFHPNPNRLIISESSSFSTDLIDEMFPKDEIPYQLHNCQSETFSIPRGSLDIRQLVDSLVKYANANLVDHTAIDYLSISSHEMFELPQPMIPVTQTSNLQQYVPPIVSTQSLGKVESQDEIKEQQNVIYVIFHDPEQYSLKLLDKIKKLINSANPRFFNVVNNVHINQTKVFLIAIDDLNRNDYHIIKSLFDGPGIELNIPVEGSMQLCTHDIKTQHAEGIIKSLYLSGELQYFTSTGALTYQPIKCYQSNKYLTFLYNFDELEVNNSIQPVKEVDDDGTLTLPEEQDQAVIHDGRGNNKKNNNKFRFVVKKRTAMVTAEDALTNDAESAFEADIPADGQLNDLESQPRKSKICLEPKCPLFRDLSLGMRLLNAYSIGQRER
jgi:hypothetical protein